LDDKQFLYENIFKLQGCFVIFQPHEDYSACIIKTLYDRKEYSACGKDIYEAFRKAFENMPKGDSYEDGFEQRRN